MNKDDVMKLLWDIACDPEEFGQTRVTACKALLQHMKKNSSRDEEELEDIDNLYQMVMSEED